MSPSGRDVIHVAIEGPEAGTSRVLYDADGVAGINDLIVVPTGTSWWWAARRCGGDPRRATRH